MIQAKPRKKRCKVCKESFEQRSSWHVACSQPCAMAIAAKAREVKAKREHKARKEAAKPLQWHLKAAEKMVNQYVRLRDQDDGCISCDKPAHWDGQWHASHFKSVGSNSVLRYHLWNIHKGCSECNHFKAGNIAEYEKRLVLKIGADRVEWLKRQGGVKRYNVDYLTRLKKIFSKKCKRIVRHKDVSAEFAENLGGKKDFSETS